MRSDIYFYGRYAIGGIISYAAPRFLVAFGIPIDRWIVMGADWLSLAITNETALWGVSTALFTVLFVVLIILDRSRPEPPIMVYGGDTLVATGVLGPKPIRDTKLHEALAFIETGKWGGRFYLVTVTPGPPNKGYSRDEFRQAARDGEIRVWGKLSEYGTHNLIEPEYWQLWTIDWFSAIEGKSRTEIAELGYQSFDRRYDLMVSKAEIEKKWPPKE